MTKLDAQFYASSTTDKNISATAMLLVRKKLESASHCHFAHKAIPLNFFVLKFY